ncbi:endonuclease/exonuclease/phosphatase family protein, partial [Nocardioides sp. CER28]
MAHGPATTAALEPSANVSLAAQPPGPTRFRVSTFNVLGAGHTGPGGDRKGYADGTTRQKMADQLIRANGLEIIGFQEMQYPQIAQFKAEMGATYDIFPGRTDGSYSVNVDGNSIAWRKDRWTALSETYYDAPYFRGKNVPKPIVLLQNRITGQQVYVTNTHNPADTQGDAQRYRDQSVDIQARTFNALRAQHPSIPIVFTGDMNDRRSFYCRFTGKSTLRAANGGTRTASACTLPPSPQIDWILGTSDVVWSGYQQLRTPYVKQATDHPLVFADASIQPLAAQRSGIKHVVVLDIEGLPAAALTGRYARHAPQIRRMMAAGAATLNARTDAETSASLPNLVSLLSGRPAAKPYGGHGVTWRKDQPHRKGRATVRAATGHYVPTLFDSVHDWGGSTSFTSSDASAALVRR